MKVKNVQALRAVAALLVIAEHLLPMEQKCLPGSVPFVKGLGAVGFTGVDLFFVISGFVIISSSWSRFNRPGSGMNFLLRRMARIFPIYWIVLLPIAILEILKPTWVNSSQVVRPDVFASFALLPQAGVPLLSVSWTLCYEMYFYYIYAFAVQRPRGQLPWIIGTWIAFTAALAAIVPDSASTYLGALRNTISYEFVFGMIIGWLFSRGYKPRWSGAVLGVGLSIILANTLFYHHEVFGGTYGNVLHGQLRFLFVGLPMAMIFYGFVGLELEEKFLLGSGLVILGDASYSLYLIHVPVLEVVTYASLHRQMLRIPLVHATWILVSVALTIAVALAVYRFIEEPLMRFLASFIRAKPAGRILSNRSTL